MHLALHRTQLLLQLLSGSLSGSQGCAGLPGGFCGGAGIPGSLLGCRVGLSQLLLQLAHHRLTVSLHLKERVRQLAQDVMTLRLVTMQDC